MKKFLAIAAVASLLILGGQAEVDAATVDKVNVPTEQTQELGKWSHFRDKYILGRETENERNDRRDWESRHNYRDDHRHGHHQPPPPPRRR